MAAAAAGESSPLPPTFVASFHDKVACEKMRYRKLGNTGMLVSVLSLGTSAFGSIYNDVSEEQCIEVCRDALKRGVNLIDSAPWYGQGKSETILGKALKGVPRESYYMNTKVGRYETDHSGMFDFTAERTIRSVFESLERLGLKYIDTIQVHDPEFAVSVDIVVRETLPALEMMRDAGYIRFIGMTGYPLEVQREIIERSKVRIDTSLTYCHYSMNDTTLLRKGDGGESFVDFLEARGIGCINAAPISMGLLTERGPPVWHPASEEVKAACKKAAAHCKEKGVNISALAVAFTLGCEDERVSTTLVSTDSLVLSRSNIERVYTPLTAEEKAVQDHVVATFAEIANPTWTGLEVEKYWEKRKECWAKLVKRKGGGEEEEEEEKEGLPEST